MAHHGPGFYVLGSGKAATGLTYTKTTSRSVANIAHFVSQFEVREKDSALFLRRFGQILIAFVFGVVGKQGQRPNNANSAELASWFFIEVIGPVKVARRQSNLADLANRLICWR